MSSNNTPNAAAGAFINEEEIPEIFHDLADEILPEAHKAMEEIAEFLEKGVIDLLSKVENIPREHPLSLEKNPPQSAAEAAALPESVRLRRAMQALACVCRDARKDLVEVSSKIEDTRDELDETLGEFEEEIKKERSQRAQQVARLQKKLEQSRAGGSGGGGTGDDDNSNNNHNNNNNDNGDQEVINELNDELALLRKQLSAEKQLRRQEAQDRADDAKRIRASAEATFQANTESLRNQVQALRQQLEQRSADERVKGQNVNDMAMLVAKMSNENTELKERKEQLDEQLKVMMAEKASRPPPTREASVMEAEIQRLGSQLAEQGQRQEKIIADLQMRLQETGTSLAAQLEESAAARDAAQRSLAETEDSRDAIRKNVDSIRAEYQSMLDSERRQLATALELATTEASSNKKALEHERISLRNAETKVFELSLQEERLTMEINALKVRLIHAEHETENANRRLTQQQQQQQQQQQKGSGINQYQQHQAPSSASVSSNRSALQQSQQQQDLSSLDAKELIKHLEGAYARNDELHKALGEADKKIYNLQLQTESSRHSFQFEIDDAERRADEARKQLLHTEKQHHMMLEALSTKQEAYLNRCVGTQAADPEIGELRSDLADARAENEALQQQLEEAFEQQRAMRENLEGKLAKETSESEATIQTLSDQLRSTRFRANKLHARLTQVEAEHAAMSAEYDSISAALKKADSQFRTAERELVDLNLENTTLRNKLKQMQREVEDLRLAMQMREREMELEYAENLKKLQHKIAKLSGGASIQPIAAPIAADQAQASTSSGGSSGGGNGAVGIGSARRPLFQQLSPSDDGAAVVVVSDVAAADDQQISSLPSSSSSLSSASINRCAEKSRQLDEIIMQIHGDSLDLDKQERTTRDQHINTAQKLQREIADLEQQISANVSGSANRVKAKLEEKRHEMVQMDTAMEKFFEMIQEKRKKLSADHSAVLAERKKLMN